MILCIVIIWFLLTVLQESGNLDAIFIVCRKKKKICNFFLQIPKQIVNYKIIELLWQLMT